jgi:hypothetical protein
MGMIIVADQGRIVYAALQGKVTMELRRAIAMAQADAEGIGAAGIIVPLVELIARSASTLDLRNI